MLSSTLSPPGPTTVLRFICAPGSSRHGVGFLVAPPRGRAHMHRACARAWGRAAGRPGGSRRAAGGHAGRVQQQLRREQRQSTERGSQRAWPGPQCGPPRPQSGSCGKQRPWAATTLAPPCSAGRGVEKTVPSGWAAVLSVHGRCRRRACRRGGTHQGALPSPRAARVAPRCCAACSTRPAAASAGEGLVGRGCHAQAQRLGGEQVAAARAAYRRRQQRGRRLRAAGPPAAPPAGAPPAACWLPQLPGLWRGGEAGSPECSVGLWRAVARSAMSSDRRTNAGMALIGCFSCRTLGIVASRARQALPIPNRLIARLQQCVDLIRGPCKRPASRPHLTQRCGVPACAPTAALCRGAIAA